MFNKNKFLALFFGALIISTGNALAYTPIGQDYHEVATKEEHKLAEGVWKKEIQNHNGNMNRSYFLENKIQAPLIKYNPDKLKKANSPYEDGLYNVYVTKFSSRSASGTSISNYIYFLQEYIDNRLQNDKDYNVYSYSVIACTYAHEAGHWYYNDIFNRGTQKHNDNNDTQKKLEFRADKFALQTVDNVPSFSVGGELIHWADNWYHQDDEHPAGSERWTATYNYIKNNSNGRVRFENNKHYTNHLIISTQGYDFEVAPPEQYTPDDNKTILAKDKDRASYVAGQVAWAIKNNCWNKASVKYEDAHQYFKDLPANVKATAIIATKGSKYKIIDWYLDPVYLTDNQKQELNDYLICLNASMDGSEFLKAVK